MCFYIFGDLIKMFLWAIQCFHVFHEHLPRFIPHRSTLKLNHLNQPIDL